MTPTQLEVWVHDIVQRLGNHQPVEDQRVELKSEWVDASRAARRLAAHANAVRGEPVLWIVGLDEKSGVVGADDSRFVDWFGKIRAQFDEVSPALSLHVAVPVQGRTLVALLFASDRAPYLVKSTVSGTPILEVPWREAAATRSAHRSELLSLLTPFLRAPDVETLWARVIVRPAGPTGPPGWVWKLEARLYVVPRAAERLVFPFHRCSATVAQGGTEMRLGPVRGEITGSQTIRAGPTEAIVDGPGLIQMLAEIEGGFEPSNEVPAASFVLQAAGTGDSTIVRFPLRPVATLPPERRWSTDGAP